MDKKTFLEYTGRLEALHAKHKDKDAALKVLYPCADVWHDTDEEISLILDLLAEFFPACRWSEDDPYKSDIEWFWYEGYDGIGDGSVTAEVDGNKYVISTFGQLYDFITQNS